MKKTRIGSDDPEATPGNRFSSLSSALETTNLAINYFERLPGETVGDCYHRHHEQEEVFYIRSGTVTFETEDGDVEAGPDEMIRFQPGEWQQGSNRGDEPATVLALGAPREEGPTDLRRECPDCGERTDVTHTPRGDGFAYICDVCGANTGPFP